LLAQRKVSDISIFFYIDLARPEPESIELDSVAVRRPDKEEETAPTSALPDNFFDKSASEKAVSKPNLY
jgi:hypothetical protein